MDSSQDKKPLRKAPIDATRVLARAYLRLLSQDTKPGTNGQLERDRDSSDFGPERLDFGPEIAMTCAGRDDNPLTRKRIR